MQEQIPDLYDSKSQEYLNQRFGVFFTSSLDTWLEYRLSTEALCSKEQ